MWGDHLLASLRRPHHIYYPVRIGLAFLFLHLLRNDTISRILWMRNRRHIFLHRRVCCECSFCQHHSGFCNYSTDRLKSWISVNAIFCIFFFIRKLDWYPFSQYMLWTIVFSYSQSNRASDNTYTNQNSRNKKASWNFWQVPAPCEWNYFNFEFS